MNFRRRILFGLAVLLISAIAVLYFFTRPAPVLTVMTWPGPYGRAQTNAQLHPYGAANNVDVRPALWDGDLATVTSMVQKHQYKADVVDFELPKAVEACQKGLLEKIDAHQLPPGANGVPAAADFVAGAIGPCWVGSMVYSRIIAFSPRLKRRPTRLADFFDVRRFRGRRVLIRASAKFNLEMALLADGVAPADVYKILGTPQGLDRAFAKLKTLDPIWADDSQGGLDRIKDGRATMAAALNGDVWSQKNFLPGVIWDHQLYELDVLGIPKGDPHKDMAQDFIAYATTSARLADFADWIALGPARRSAIALVRNNPETGMAVRPLLPTAPENFRNAFAIDDGWWLAHGAQIAARWQKFVSP